MSNLSSKITTYRKGCNSRAFRAGYEDARTGRTPRFGEWGRANTMYEYGRLTVAYAIGEGDNAIPVAVHRKLATGVLSTISLQCARMIAATSTCSGQRYFAQRVLANERLAA